MFSSKALLSLVFIVLTAVDASLFGREDGDKTTISFTTKINGLDARTIVKKDRARVEAMKLASHLHKRDGTSFSLLGGAFYHTMNVGIGQPPSHYNLIFDTGSSITWVGRNESHPYKQTSTSVSTGKNVSVVYGSAAFSGKGWNDTLVLSSNLKINQFIAEATATRGIPAGIDGIIGFGPVGLTDGTVSNTSKVPTVMDNLHSQRNIRDVFVVSIDPEKGGGNITIGGIDDDIAEKMAWTPLATTYPSSEYWGFNASWCSGHTTILATRPGIVDAGTSLIQLAPNAFNRFVTLTGATMADNGFLRLNSSQFHNLQNLTLHIGEKPYHLIPEAQVWPPKRNKEIGGDSDSYYLLVALLEGFYNPESSGPASDPDDGFNFVVGLPFLQRYDSAYDGENKRLGLAATAYTYSGFS